MHPPEPIRTPRVLLPAPGLPALLEHPRAQFEAIVCHRLANDDLRAWAAELQLRGRSGEAVPLAVAHIDEDIDPARSLAAQAAELCDGGELRWTRLRLIAAVDPPRAPRSAAVFDLYHRHLCLRRNAVARLTPGRELRIALASDLHIAALWDRVREAIRRHAADLERVALHPSDLLAEFVAAANARAARGELDLVVLSGDLVDHVHAEPREAIERGERHSNVERLLDILAGLEVPFAAIPGNHDYRLFPWRPRVYGLGSIGLSGVQHERLLRAAGWWDTMPIRRRDLDAIRTQAAGHVPALLHHLTAVAPAIDFHLDVRGMRLVFVNSGRDVILNWHRVERSRRDLLLRALRHTWVDPDSEGLSERQTRRLDAALSSAPAAAVFVHAPLLHPRPHLARAPLDLHPRDAERPAEHRAYERRLFDTGQRGGVLFRNPAALVRSLAAAPGPVSLFSGHVHKATLVEVERDTLRGRLAEFAAPAAGSEVIAMVTAPSLGHYRRVGGEGPGYLTATFRDGVLRQLERHGLPSLDHRTSTHSR